ncbi:MAG TPA: glutamine--fructose-6-phosphate transaminase (isomerizing), partial [bacterium]|nr:glutamine--fructose-6-phosphate transaminase (isomerizing) [bacterium]
MCGIAGYSGNKSAELQIIQTLKKLEHRGYDSAGIALLNKNSIYIVKAVGKINALEEKLHSHQIDSHLGIGHTRWATHGKVCIENTHPHQDCKKCIAVVHNGIIENYRQIKKKLESQHKFQSATDTEVIPHLIEHFLQETNSIEEAFLKTIKSLTGSFAIAMIYKNDNRIFFAQKNSTLIIYQDAEETYLVSDPAGLPEKAKDIIPVQDDEWGMISNGTICLFDITGKIKKPRSIVFNQNIKNENAQHFFLKEIFQQPETIISTLRSSLSFFDTTGKNIFKDIDKILFIGCGSSYYAGLIGKYFFEEIAKIPSAVEYASEISCLLNSNGKNTLVIALSQSGETRDTISAVKKIQESRILAITNVANSLITRIVPYHILLHVGPEISVAATKSFTGQIICLYVASLKLAYEKG